MTEVKWTLKNVKSNEVVHITKPIFRVGRHITADVKTELKEVSRNHATLSILIGGHLYIQDNGSCNGTFVNQRKIEPMNNVLLDHGDIVGFGMPAQMMDEYPNTTPLIFQVSREVMNSLVNGHVEDPEDNKEVIQIMDSLEEIHMAAPIEANGDVEVEPNANELEELDSIMPVDANGDRLVDPSDVRPVDMNVDNPVDTHDEECQKVISSTDDEVEEKLHYSVNDRDCIIDECIVISDEEDDEPFAHSQIFNISEKIKLEQTSYHDSIDPYFEIKQELTDLQCDAENQIPVDLTDDIDHFESTTDLLNILENSESFEAKTRENPGTSSADDLKELLETDLTQERRKQQKKEESIGNIVDNVTITSTSKRDSNDAVTTRSKRAEENKMKYHATDPPDPKLVVSLVRESDLKRLNQISMQKGNTRTVKVIPPMAISYANKEKKEPAPKRKSTKTDFETNKKLRTSKAEKPAIRLSEPVTPVKKKEIALERKKKLREIAVKGSRDTDSRKKPPKSPVSTDSHTVPSTSTGITRDPRRCRKERIGVDRNARKSDKPALHSIKVTHNDIQDETISSNFSPKSDSNQNLFKHPATTANNKSLATASNKSLASPKADSTVPEDRSGIIWNIGSKAHSVSTVSRHVDDVTDEIHRILRWSVKWLMEQNNLDISPPVYGDRKLVHVPHYFESYSQYEAVMSPLIMLELWQLIHQTAYSKEDERIPVTAIITHERKLDPVCCLDCQVTMGNSEIFRPEDFCLIELKVVDTLNNNGYQYTSYGYIKHVNKTFQGKGFLVRFTLLTKNFNMPIRANKILVKVIGNVSSSFRLFKTMKYLVSSPLCKYVFQPNKIEQIQCSTKNIMLGSCKLNSLQEKIVSEASELCMRSSPGFYLIKGPPGTGKSTVITSIVLNVLFKSIATNKPALILLTAPSNAAVDGLLLKLMDIRLKLSDTQKKSLKLVRIGPDSSISQKVNKFKLNTLARNNILVDKALVTLEEYNHCMDNFSSVDQFLRKHLGQRFMYEVNAAEDTLLHGANVICTTLNSCVGYRISQAVRKRFLKFTCCIIDEATQCNEVESLIPIQLGIDKFVLVGDPKQLPAVVCNKEAQKLGYGSSLFSRIDESLKNKSKSPIRMLTTQYRMKREICEYPNKAYYEGKLISSPIIKNPIRPAVKPYLVFNLTRNESRDASDYVNSDEVHLIRILLETLKSCVDPAREYSVGIITPYKAQKELVSREMANIRMPSKVSVAVNTVDSFQGLENDIIIISCVRYTANYFLQNEQRLNVALTRAKQALYIIGNYALFKHCRPLYDLREDAKRRKCLLDIRDDPGRISSLHKYIME